MEQQQLKKADKTQDNEEIIEDPIPDTTTAKEKVEATDKLLDDIDLLLDQQAVETLRQQAKDKPKSVTLWDLMREGAGVTDQAIGSWSIVQGLKGRGETCALSAAMLAARARGLG